MLKPELIRGEASYKRTLGLQGARVGVEGRNVCNILVRNPQHKKVYKVEGTVVTEQHMHKLVSSFRRGGTQQLP